MNKLFIKERYAKIRSARNISARKLSLELGQSTEYINQIENGKSMPSLEGLINFCEYFKISISEFFDENLTHLLQYKELFQQLNKLDEMKLKIVMDLIKLLV